MRLKQLIFVGVIAVITLICFGLMSQNYDSLSRYPYNDEHARRLIKKHLNRQEIEYIIEYSIEPNYFIPFIENNKFSVYKANEYNEIASVVWDIDGFDVVTLVEESRDMYSLDHLKNLLGEYTGQTLLYWVLNQEQFANQILIENPNAIDAYVDMNHTVLTRVPDNLYQIEDNLSLYKDTILLSKSMKIDLENMCQAISADLKLTPCGGLRIVNGYNSFDELEIIYNEAKQNGTDLNQLELPGHSEHQLGLAIDFKVPYTDLDKFASTKQYKWLQENAYKYGFVQTYIEDTIEDTGISEQLYHYRFVGKNVALKMFENEVSLKEVTYQ